MNTQRGFTLVELSIVLVILGLLIGGVLTGQSLIRAAELRSISTQYARYITAANTFKDKYFALPGDMTNATAYWGIAPGSSTGSDTACITAASSTAATCNGDGNGQIDTYIGTSPGSNEKFRFWQHLANAGLIEGSYDGVAHGSATDSSNSLNVPSGRINSSLWSVAYSATFAGKSFAFDGVYENFLKIGGITNNNSPVSGFLKPEEVYNLDTKMDDGLPATGKLVVIAYTSGLSGCTNTSTSTNLAATYLLTNTALNCAPIFRQAF